MKTENEYKYPKNLDFDANLGKILNKYMTNCAFCENTAHYIFTVEDEKAKEWEQHARSWMLCEDCAKKLYNHIMEGGFIRSFWT